MGKLGCKANSEAALANAGATFGLYTALTGVKLPGQATAVAEGNALGKGALVYHLFPSALQTIQARAAGEPCIPTAVSVNVQAQEPVPSALAYTGSPTNVMHFSKGNLSLQHSLVHYV